MKYSYSISQVEDHGDIIWLAQSKELKNCLGAGDTQEEALAELEENEAIWLDMAQEKGFPIPEVRVEKLPEYSGKLTLRISPKEHELAAKQAQEQKISLNAYICNSIIAYSRESV